MFFETCPEKCSHHQSEISDNRTTALTIIGQPADVYSMVLVGARELVGAGCLASDTLSHDQVERAAALLRNHPLKSAKKGIRYNQGNNLSVIKAVIVAVVMVVHGRDLRSCSYQSVATAVVDNLVFCGMSLEPLCGSKPQALLYLHIYTAVRVCVCLCVCVRSSSDIVKRGLARGSPSPVVGCPSTPRRFYYS